MLKIDLDTAEQIVAKNKNLYWDGWTLVHVKPSPNGWLRANGLLRNGRWHVQTRYIVDSDGKYTIPKALGHGIQS